MHEGEETYVVAHCTKKTTLLVICSFLQQILARGRPIVFRKSLFSKWVSPSFTPSEIRSGACMEVLEWTLVSILQFVSAPLVLSGRPRHDSHLEAGMRGKLLLLLLLLLVRLLPAPSFLDFGVPDSGLLPAVAASWSSRKARRRYDRIV